MSDTPSVYRETTPKAAKEHKCCECRRAIKPGETYQRIEGCWDGDWITFKTCHPCAEKRQGIITLALDKGYRDDEMPAFGELHEYAQEVTRW